MAAATPGGSGGGDGDSVRDSVGGNRGVDSGAGSGADSCAGRDGGAGHGGGAGTPQSPVSLTPEARAAKAFAAAVLSSPAKTSHQWASSFGGGV